MTYSKKQQLFIDELLNGSNIFLTGKAGTGKSFIVKEAIKKLKESGKRVVAIAPTGVAANNIQGQTIHSMFSLTPFGVLTYDECSFLKSEKKKLMKKIDTIFIDEVSMLRPDILDAIQWTLIKNGIDGGLINKQIIFIGDLKQLPAPIDDNMRSVLWKIYDGDEFSNAKIYQKLNVISIELDEVLRQSNEEFVLNLNIVRDGGKSPYFKKFVGSDQKGIVLAPHNSTVAKYNKAGIDSINEKEIVFTAKVEGNVKAEEFNVESKIHVKEGAKIMYLANSQNNPLVNGTLGVFKVKKIEGKEDKYFIQVKGEEFAINPIKFTKKEYVFNDSIQALELQDIGSIEQMPIKLAYALSIHKSQGLTFDEVTVDLSRPCFQKGQMYVALSRVTSPDGLRIII